MKDYLFTDNLVGCIVCAVFHRNSSRGVMSGSGVGRSANDLLRILAETVKREVTVAYTPGKPHDVSGIVLDITRAKRELDWAPVTPIEIGIEKTWDFIKEVAT